MATLALHVIVDESASNAYVYAQVTVHSTKVALPCEVGQTCTV